MKQYVVKKGNSYLVTVYKNSTSVSTDVGEAMKFDSIEMANQFLAYVKVIIKTNDELDVYCIETTITKVSENND